MKNLDFVLNTDDKYKEILDHVIILGEEVPTRNGIAITSFNVHMSFQSFPCVTLRKTAYKNSFKEMEWFLSGSTNINDLDPSVRKWWGPWADSSGRIKNSYGENFINNGFNQVSKIIEQINQDPYSRRHVLSLWDTEKMLSKETPLANCHGTVIQFFVDLGNNLYITMYQRSADLIMGVPHNWTQYWALGSYVSSQTKTKLKEFNWYGGNCHIYKDHLDVAYKILKSPDRDTDIRFVDQHSQGDRFNHLNFIVENIPEPIVKNKINLIV